MVEGKEGPLKNGVPGPGGGKHPPGFTKDMLKPLIFGNHQSHFKMFNTLVCVVLGYYLVFEHDFGSKRHVFSPLRDWKSRLMEKLFNVNLEDQKVQAMKEEMIKKHEQKRTKQSSSLAARNVK